MKNGKKLLACISGGLLLASLLQCGSETGQEAETVRIPVQIAEVTQSEISTPVVTSGLLSSKNQVRLSFKIGGIVDKIYVGEGQQVKEGRLLASLKLPEIQAQVEQASSALEKAKRDYERVKNLYSDSVATLEQLQNSETAVTMAASGLEIARFNLRHASINAPSGGRILKRFVETNEMVRPGDPIIYFGSTSGDWVVNAGVADRDIVRLEIGDSARLSFDAYPGKIFRAEVSEISGAADPMSGTFEVELRMKGNKNRLMSGFVAEVEIFPSKTVTCYLIPATALAEADGDRGAVYRLNTDGNSVSKQAVRIWKILDNQVAIHSGLKTGQKIAADGAQYLSDGAAVQIVN